MANGDKLANELRFNKHRKRKNNDKVAAMYAMYQTGKSLEKIGRIYRKTRQTVYDVFKTRGYELRRKMLVGLLQVDGIQFTKTKGNHYRGTKDGKRILLHRYLWEKYHGPVPYEHVVYHIDRNVLNNDPSNLGVLMKNKMGRSFNPEGRNQYTYRKS